MTHFNPVSNSSQPTESPSNFIQEAKHDLSAPLIHICNVTERLLEGTSLNKFNRTILAEILKSTRELLSEYTSPSSSHTPSLQTKATNLIDTFLFCVCSQNYCSPSSSRSGTVIQTGLVNLSHWIKYLRSELNTPVFGDPYDRNTVLIRSNASESFSELVSKYVAHSPAKHVRRVNNLDDRETKLGVQLGEMLVLDPCMNGVALIDQLKSFFQSDCPTDFEGGIYVRLLEPLGTEQLQSIKDLLSKTKAQIVLEEPYDPFKVELSGMKKITFIHDQTDNLRYQLIQDAASLGYRPTLNETVRYYFNACRLGELLNYNGKTEDTYPDYPYNETVLTNGNDREERDRDYQVLLATLANCRHSLESLMGSNDDLTLTILSQTSRELNNIEEDLLSTLQDENNSVKDTIETCHS